MWYRRERKKKSHTHNKQKLGSFYCIQTKEMNYFSYHINCRGNRIACKKISFSPAYCLLCSKHTPGAARRRPASLWG